MAWTELATVLAVLGISAWVGRNTTVGARLALGVTALLVSAGMFLPASTLRALVGPIGLATLSSGASPWSLEAVAHFIAFLWLALMVWTLRPDLRGWKALTVLVALAIAAEIIQGLTVERSTRLDDVGVNLLGAGAGVGLASIALFVRVRLCNARVDDSLC